MNHDANKKTILLSKLKKIIWIEKNNFDEKIHFSSIILLIVFFANVYFYYYIIK
jgi:hypothetical protein